MEGRGNDKGNGKEDIVEIKEPGEGRRREGKEGGGKVRKKGRTNDWRREVKVIGNGEGKIGGKERSREWVVR